MKKVKIGIITFLIILTGILIYTFRISTTVMDTSDVQKVFLETISMNGEYKKIPIKDLQDIKTIKSALSGKLVKEPGLVFAEGGYRIVLEKPNKEERLYPYCGDLQVIRAGDQGHIYCSMNENEESFKTFEEVIKKYIDLEQYRGVYDWEHP